MPEPHEWAKWILERMARKAVLEFGCGPGRIPWLFTNMEKVINTYVGVDINKEAIEFARGIHADREGIEFREIEAPDKLIRLPAREVMLAHTVFLHLDDNDMHLVLMALRCPSVIVSEVMGREYAHPGNEEVPPCFNRAPGDYEHLFEFYGYKLVDADIFKYQDKHLTTMLFRGA